MPDIYLRPGEVNPNDIRLQQNPPAPGFEAATSPAMAQLVDCYRNVRNCSLYKDGERKPFAGNAVGAASEEAPGYDPATESWAIRSERTHARVLIQRETTDHLAWLSVPVPIVGWTVLDRRMPPVPHPVVAPWPDDAWLYRALDGPFDPALQSWEIPADRMARPLAVWKDDTNLGAGWIPPELVFPFDPALFPGIAQLDGVRTRPAPWMHVQVQWFVYDLSWVHDVIPLTETPAEPSTFRPNSIAPIMNRRRRRRR